MSIHGPYPHGQRWRLVERVGRRTKMHSYATREEAEIGKVKLEVAREAVSSRVFERMVNVRLDAHTHRQIEAISGHLNLPLATVMRSLAAQALRDHGALSIRRLERGMREKLPEEREGNNHHFVLTVANKNGTGTYAVDGYLRANTYPDGRLAEIFLVVGKQGSAESAYDAWAISCSIALQHGASVTELFSKFVGYHSEPFGATSNKDIPRCSGLHDYAARYLLAKFAKPIEVVETGAAS